MKNKKFWKKKYWLVRDMFMADDTDILYKYKFYYFIYLESFMFDKNYVVLLFWSKMLLCLLSLLLYMYIYMFYYNNFLLFMDNLSVNIYIIMMILFLILFFYWFLLIFMDFIFMKMYEMKFKSELNKKKKEQYFNIINLKSENLESMEMTTYDFFFIMLFFFFNNFFNIVMFSFLFKMSMKNFIMLNGFFIFYNYMLLFFYLYFLWKNNNSKVSTLSLFFLPLFFHYPLIYLFLFFIFAKKKTYLNELFFDSLETKYESYLFFYDKVDYDKVSKKYFKVMLK